MTSDEILAVIRERFKVWAASEYARDPRIANILDDLDPDRIDAQGKLREELAQAISQDQTQGPPIQPWCYHLADALLKKGWRK